MTMSVLLPKVFVILNLGTFIEGERIWTMHPVSLMFSQSLTMDKNCAFLTCSPNLSSHETPIVLISLS